MADEAWTETRGRPATRKRGRPLSDRHALQTVLMLLLGTLKGWSLKQLQERVSHYQDPRWRPLCGIAYSDVPPYSTLVYRAPHPQVKRWQERLYRRMLPALLNCRNLGLLALDMTTCPEICEISWPTGGSAARGRSTATSSICW